MAQPRAPRADAARNRELLLAAAADVLATEGAAASLERIARTAGVGIGTLYRHFPTRETLVEAVYREELSRLCDAAPTLLAAEPADRALRTWIDRFSDYLAAKRELGDALGEVIAAGGNPFAETRSRMVAAVGSLLTAGAEQGSLRDDVDPDDVVVALSGISAATVGRDDREQAGRLADLLVDGLRLR